MINVFRKRIDRLIHGDDGAALVVTLALFMMMYISCAGVFAIGKTVKEKMILQNAADAAAYSAAIVQADTLSRIATLNREMAWVYKDMVCRQMDYIVCKWLEDASIDGGDVRELYKADEAISTWIGDLTGTIPASINPRNKIPPALLLDLQAEVPVRKNILLGKIIDDNNTISELGKAIDDLIYEYDERIEQVVDDVLIANLPDTYAKDCYWDYNANSIANMMEGVGGGEYNEARFLDFAELDQSEFRDWFEVDDASLKHRCSNRGFFKTSWAFRLKVPPYSLVPHLNEPYDHVTKVTGDFAFVKSARPRVLTKDYFANGDGVRAGAISVGVAKCNRNPWEGLVKTGLDGKKRGLYEVFQPLIGAIDWTWAIASAQAGYIDRPKDVDQRKALYTGVDDTGNFVEGAKAYTVDWEGDGDWNLRTDNWDAVYVPVCQSFAEDDFASWIKGDWKVLSKNSASDLPAYSPDTMTKALPQMHNAGMPYAPLDWGGLLGKIYH